MNDGSKGPLFTVISAVLLTFSFVSIKYLLNFTNPVTLNFLWIGSGLLVAMSIARVKQIKWFPVVRKYWNVGLVFGIFIGIGSILMFHAIDSIGPSLSSFIVRFSMVFTVILGVVFLKERLIGFEILGMLVASSGVVLINFASGNVLQPASLFVLIAAFMFAANGVVTKLYVKRINPLELIILRDIFAVVFVLLYAMMAGKFQAVSLNLIGLTLLTSTLTVFGFLFFLRALQLMDLTKVTIIRSIDPFLVVVYSLIIFKTIPTLMQMLGGILIVAGVIMIVVKHRIKKTAGTLYYGVLRFVER